jgi:hypothetical protein
MSSVTVNVTAYTSAHTVAHVTSKMLLVLKEIIREVGLDPSKLANEWSSLERAVSTWLMSRHMKQLTLEIFNPRTDALVSRWDLDILYGYGADESFWVDTYGIRYSIAKAGLVASHCNYRFLIYNSPGRPDVEGWSPGSERSTEGFGRYSVGATIGGNGIGTEVAYWKKL